MAAWALQVLLLVSAINALGLLAVLVHLWARGGAWRDVTARLAEVEKDVGVRPTHRDLAEIRSLLTSVMSELAAMRERTEISALALRTIQQHLTEKK